MKIKDWFTRLQRQRAHQRWLKDGYLSNIQHAAVYKLRHEYQFVAEHQAKEGLLYEDEHVEIRPDSISDEEFEACLLSALSRSAAINFALKTYDRKLFLQRHRVHSYKELYQNTLCLGIRYDTDLQEIGMQLSAQTDRKGVTPLAIPVKQSR